MITYRRHVLGGRLPPAPPPPASEVAASPPPRVPGAWEAEAEPEVVLDRLAFILGPSRPASADSVLRQLLVMVSSSSVRLCLRARGALPDLLDAAHRVAADASSACRQDARRLHMSVLRCLAADAAGHGLILTRALPDLLDVASMLPSEAGRAPEGKTASPPADGARQATPPAAGVEPETGGPAALLKRRKLGPTATRLGQPREPLASCPSSPSPSDTGLGAPVTALLVLRDSLRGLRGSPAKRRARCSAA